MKTTQTSVQAVMGIVVLLLVTATHTAASSVRSSHRYQARRRHSKQPDTHLILSGQRVGPVRLNDSREELQSALAAFARREGRLAASLDSMTRLQGFDECGLSVDEIDWPPVSPPRNGPGLVFIYLSRGRVFQVQSGSNVFHTASGLTAGSTPEEVKREAYPLKAYALLNDHYDAIWNRDLIYWVSEARGIAFAFAYEGPALGRRVWTIDVFKPGTEFRPGGCVEYPQKWEKLAPYTIELPNPGPTTAPVGGTRASEGTAER